VREQAYSAAAPDDLAIAAIVPLFLQVPLTFVLATWIGYLRVQAIKRDAAA
jgi:hypothetical protein